ncbi:MAG: hypothetical protein M3483_03670 [Gemmatimonadota bacterium]|nr:hypothetical protein [Gemmatimonadota bacterium]
MVLASSACDVLERVTDRRSTVVVDTTGVSASAGGFLLSMQMPGVLGASQEGIVRLSLTNRGDTVPRGVTLDLLLPLWIEPVPPRPGDRPVTIEASTEDGLRLSYRMDEAALEPGQTQTIEQRIRVPARAPSGAMTGQQIVRARLIDPDGQPLVEVASKLAMDGTAATDSISGAAGDPAVEPDGVGSVRLGMPRDSVLRVASGARDTSWQQEGSQQRGLLVPFDNSARALAVLSGDTVTRIEVRGSSIRAHGRVGVGSTLQELRAAYGRPCAAVGEGFVVVWFPSAPGISFALDAPIPQNPQQIGDDTDRIPATSRVTRWWVRRGTDTCN